MLLVWKNDKDEQPVKRKEKKLKTKPELAYILKGKAMHNLHTHQVLHLTLFLSTLCFLRTLLFAHILSSFLALSLFFEFEMKNTEEFAFLK